MKKLSPNWFVEGTLDFEYKKYILLAYLQDVSQEFAEMRLYPAFADLIYHYQNLAQFQAKKQRLSNRFPKQLDKDEFRRMQLSYNPEITDDETLDEIESIVNYAIPQLKPSLKAGKEIYEFTEEHIEIEPVGITPLYKNEGYILIRVENQQDVDAFEYRIVFLENTDANYHGISFTHLDSFRLSLSNTYEAIRKNLIQTYTKLPNPATYLLYAHKPFPWKSTLIPMAKRIMLGYLKNDKSALG